MITRRQFAASTPLLAASALVLSGCSAEPAAEGYEAVAERTWQANILTSLSGATLGRELVRCATLAPSSHNTQCWKFALDANGQSISILPDLARRCPAVDPDDHHIFVSLGCAAENLIQAALAHGFMGDAQFDAARGGHRFLPVCQRTDAPPATSVLSSWYRPTCSARDLPSRLLERAGFWAMARVLVIDDFAPVRNAVTTLPHGSRMERKTGCSSA